MNRRMLAILAATGASTIYGINHTLAKGVMPTYIEPFGFIFLRGGRCCSYVLAHQFLGAKGKNCDKRLAQNSGMYHFWDGNQYADVL